VGFIRLLFPDARIIYTDRDVLDTTVSVFTQHFMVLQSRSLEHIARTIVAIKRLLRFWEEDVNVPMLKVDYEDLINDFEEQARRIVEYVGLPWHDACLHFHRNKRKVDTPSRNQVNRPIYNSSVGRWRRFERYLQPAMAVFDDARAWGDI